MLKLKCANCGSTIDKTRSSYYVKQEIYEGLIKEIEFCDRKCIDRYEEQLIENLQ